MPGADSSLDSLVERTAGLQPWRRAFHATNGIVIAVALTFFVSRGLAVLLLSGIFALALGLDLVRLRSAAANRLFFQAFSTLASPREARGIASSTWYALGVLLVVALFPTEIAVASILVLALADPAASYVGRRWGRRRFGVGTVEGTLVFFAVSLAVLLIFRTPLHALAVAAFVGYMERFPWRLDDNLTIPLLAAAAQWALAML